MSGDELVRRLIRPSILAAAAYRVPDASGLIKLDAMENPYPCPGSLRDEWLEQLRGVNLNLYPDANARELKHRLRSVFAVPAGMDLFLGNGSDEIIQIITLALARPGSVALVIEPTFVMYGVSAGAAGMGVVGVPLLAPDCSLDLEALETAFERNRPAVTFLAWPNNPTGTLFPRGALEQIVHRAPGLVVVDEAYYPFSGETLMADLARYENLLVLRTLSKLGLAGLRLGFLAGHARWLEQFEKIRPPYNVGTLAQVSAAFFLDRMDVFADQARRICGERDRLSRRLAALAQVTLWPGAGNFLMFRVNSAPAAGVYDGLKSRGILIKLLDGAHPLLAGCLRVSVGGPEENDAFVAALAAVLDDR